MTSKLIPQKALDKLRGLSKELNPNYPQYGVMTEMVDTLKKHGFQMTRFDLKLSKNHKKLFVKF